MGTVIDSSVFVAAERGKLDLSGIVGPEPYVIAAVTASELLHGVHRAATAAQRTRREAFVERVLASTPIVAFDLVVARVQARIAADLARRGIVLGAHDAQIAATATSLGYSVTTRDLRSFPRIPGLVIRKP